MALQTHNRHKPLTEINIIPLVDVILVLLIVFMLTAPLLQQSINIDLPQASADDSGAGQEAFFLSLNKDGKIYLPGKKSEVYTLTTVVDKLALIYGTRQDKSMYLRADKDVSYGLVVEVMSAAKKAGIEKIGLVTVPDTQKK